MFAYRNIICLSTGLFTLQGKNQVICCHPCLPLHRLISPGTNMGCDYGIFCHQNRVISRRGLHIQYISPVSADYSLV